MSLNMVCGDIKKLPVRAVFCGRSLLLSFLLDVLAVLSELIIVREDFFFWLAIFIKCDLNEDFVSFFRKHNLCGKRGCELFHVFRAVELFSFYIAESASLRCFSVECVEHYIDCNDNVVVLFGD